MAVFSGIAYQGVFSFLPWRQAPEFFWRCPPACPFFSNPFFLQKKKWVRGSRKRTQRKPFKKVSSGLLRKQRGRGPFETPGCTIVPRKDFCSAKMLCGGRIERFAARHSDCRKSIQTRKIRQIGKRVLTKTCKHSRFVKYEKHRTPGSLRGRSPSVRGGVARGTTRRFPLRNFFPAARHGDRRAAKKRGVEKSKLVCNTRKKWAAFAAQKLYFPLPSA